jgi:hypothetical protein
MSAEPPPILAPVFHLNLYRTETVADALKVYKLAKDRGVSEEHARNVAAATVARQRGHRPSLVKRELVRLLEPARFPRRLI